jgi:hypothetical protein
MDRAVVGVSGSLIVGRANCNTIIQATVRAAARVNMSGSSNLIERAIGLLRSSYRRVQAGWARRESAEPAAREPSIEAQISAPVAAGPTPERRTQLEATLKAYQDGRLFPPKNVRDPAACDEYWRNMLQFGTMEMSFGDMMASSPKLISLLMARDVRTILCAGNGMSSEALAFALHGFEVTALDLSAVPREFFEHVLCSSENPLVRDVGVTVRDDGVFVFGTGPIDPKHCPPIHRGDHTPDGGGLLHCVTGDLLDVSICPGPFDVVIERRTVQLFPPASQPAALDALEGRLAPRGVFVSHQHNGVWRPGEDRTHYGKAWTEARGFVTPGADDLNRKASRLAYFVYTSG